MAHRPPSASDIQRGHEEIDLPSGRGFVYFLMGFVAFAAVVHVTLWWLYGALRPAPLPISPLADRAPLPPEPRLQGTVVHPTLDVQDMSALRRAEDEKLNGYGWANRQAGVVRIPIENAIRLTLERGLPKPAPATQTAPAGG